MKAQVLIVVGIVTAVVVVFAAAVFWYLQQAFKGLG